MTQTISDARIEIRDVVENWALWRDAGDWERFATVWHPDGYMAATWFQGSAEEFIAVSREAFQRGVNILHLLGGTSVEVLGDRGVAQTRMTILQRAVVDGIEVDVSCVGRFYDFFEQLVDGAWKIRRRQPIYEKDRLDVVDPGSTLAVDDALLRRFPAGYRYLAYLQTKAGHTVKNGLPGSTGLAAERLYREGRDWLGGALTAGIPL